VATLSPATRTVVSAERFRALVSTAPNQEGSRRHPLGVGPPDEPVWPS